MKLTDISDAGMFVQAKFAHTNKQDTLRSYYTQISLDEYHTERCKVAAVATMDTAEFDKFTSYLLTDVEWLGMDTGGTFSDDPRLPTDDRPFWKFTDEEQAIFKATCYLMVIAVCAPNKRTIYVDSQGYNYARYVGI